MEAVTRYRDAYTPDLAGSLNNVSAALSAHGQRGEALAYAKESVALFRALAARYPGRYAEALAGSSRNLARRGGADEV